MPKYLIATKHDNQVVFIIEAINDAHSWIVAIEHMTSLGLTVRDIKLNYNVYKQGE